MKKTVFFCVLFIGLALNGFAQLDDISTCFETYKTQKAMGYNALAMAVDNGFSVCGFAFGGFSKQSVSKQSLNECEMKRLDPSLKVEGVRKIMTHCRIYQFDRIEPKPE
jgi:hypothetical protein